MAEQTVNRTKEVRLGYLQSVQASANELDLYAAGGVSGQRTKRELTFSDQKTTFIPGAGESVPGETTVQGHAVGDTGWAKNGVEQYVMYDRARIAVGVRDVELGRVRYAEEGVIITKPYWTRRPVRAISLDVNEYIPPSFPEDKYIMYSVSFDGESWTEILPRGSAITDDIPKRLTVNFSDDDDSEQVSVEGKPKRVYLKIEMKRPADAAFVGVSPVLRNFDLHVEVEQ